jgi:hypothetical protein
LSEPPKEKVGVVSLVGPEGPEIMVASGALLSILTVKVCYASALPALSVAW